MLSFLLKKIKDQRKSECPYCRKKIEKVPERKIKCSNCGNYIYVRTEPKGNIRMVVTREEAEKIDELWRIKNGTQDSYISEKKRFDDQKESLKRKRKKEPNDTSVRWSLINEDALNYLKKGQIANYAWSRVEFAKISQKELKLENSLWFYISYCYLLINGARNLALDQDGNIFNHKENKLFDLSFYNSLPPGILSEIKKIIKKIGLNDNKLKDIFLDSALKTRKAVNAPLSPEESYKIFKKELEDCK